MCNLGWYLYTTRHLKANVQYCRGRHLTIYWALNQCTEIVPMERNRLRGDSKSHFYHIIIIRWISKIFNMNNSSMQYDKRTLKMCGPGIFKTSFKNLFDRSKFNLQTYIIDSCTYCDPVASDTLVNIGSGNDLSPVQYRAITPRNNTILCFSWTITTSFGEILIEFN